MQDIKSLILFLGNCGPLYTDLGVSTMRPEVTERKLLSLNSTLLYSNTDLITRDLAACTLKTGWKPLLQKGFDWKEPSGWACAPEHVAPARYINFYKKAKLQGRKEHHRVKLQLLLVTMALEIRNRVSVCFNARYFRLATTPAVTNLCSSATCPRPGP